MSTTSLGMLFVILLFAQAAPRTRKEQKTGQNLPTIGIEDSHGCGPVRSAAVTEKTLSGAQLEALIAVRQLVMKEEFRFFAGADNSNCFATTGAYFFVVFPADDVTGVAVLDNGSCHPPGWVGADRQLLFEYRDGKILKISRGEEGAARGEELRRVTQSAATRACK